MNGYCMKRMSVGKFLVQLLYSIQITEVRNPVEGMVFLIQAEVDPAQLHSISAFCSICCTVHEKLCKNYVCSRV